jgi:hypothetical protein
MSRKKRIVVKFFLSYAHENMQLAILFKKLILQQMGPSITYEYRIWSDLDNLLPGQNWVKEVKQALKECDLGLLLISPSFLNSKFITESELPVFIGNKAKACIPVLLSPVNFRRHDLKGMKTTQIYRYRTTRGNLKNFSDCTKRQREQFCEQLFDKIESRLDELHLK